MMTVEFLAIIANCVFKLHLCPWNEKKKKVMSGQKSGSFVALFKQ